MDLKALQGMHVLDACDYGGNEDRGYFVVSAIRFRLDGVVYLGKENPDDGYRSFLDDLEVVKEPVKNVFHPVHVCCVLSPKAGDDILQMYALDNNQLVLEVGTDRDDDYYPSCVMVFYPQNLPPPEPSEVTIGARRMRIRRA